MFDYLKNKKILILGATGLIGSHIIFELLRANREEKAEITIYAMSRNLLRLKEIFGLSGDGEDGLFYVEGDVATAKLSALDYIIHGASPSHPSAFVNSPVEVMQANFLGTWNVCELAKENPGCRVLYLSSGEAGQNVDNLTVRASYPMSKKASETLCISYSEEYNVDVRIARICHTFGEGGLAADNKMTAQFLRSGARAEDIVMLSKGEQRRSFAYVEDVVSALLTILGKGEKGGVYEVASDEVCSIHEFALLCAKAGGCEVRMEAPDELNLKQRSPFADQILDNAKLKELGWKPAYTIERGIEESIRRMRVKHNGKGIGSN